MKTNKLKAFKLIQKGLSAKTVSKLTESQLNTLYNKIIVEATETVTKQKTYTADEINSMKVKGQSMPGGKAVKVNPDNSVTVTMEGEMDEDVEVTTDPNKETETQDAKQVGPSSDDGFGSEDDGMGMFEEKDYKGKKNPWAICHAQVGPKKTRKFERCVQSVKKQLKEGKNPVSLFIENKIMDIVERNLPPKITKGDLMKYLNETDNFATKHIQSQFGVKSKVKKEVGESSPSTAPTTKPAPTKPGTKTPPKPRPSHPGKNPNPGEKEAPKAKNISPERAKEEIIDLIINLLQK